MKSPIWAVLLLAMSLPAQTTPGTSLTIYNQNFGLVRERIPYCPKTRPTV